MLWQKVRLLEHSSGEEAHATTLSSRAGYGHQGALHVLITGLRWKMQKKVAYGMLSAASDRKTETADMQDSQCKHDRPQQQFPFTAEGTQLEGHDLLHTAPTVRLECLSTEVFAFHAIIHRLKCGALVCCVQVILAARQQGDKSRVRLAGSRTLEICSSRRRTSCWRSEL